MIVNAPTPPNLVIDPTIRQLIAPPKKRYIKKLEKSLLSDGCKQPLIVWDGIILDGHLRYELCLRHNIPFSISEMEFNSREAAVAWVCRHQLDRMDLTEEYRRYLIGALYEAEKIANLPEIKLRRKKFRKKAKSGATSEDEDSIQLDGNKHVTAERIAEQYHVAYATVQKYAIYTRTINKIGEKVPELPPRILAGHYKVSHNSLLELAEMHPDRIRRVMKGVELNNQPITKFSKMRAEIKEQASIPTPPSSTGSASQSIKDMPAYDPDAEITGLSLTIPSWVSSMERAKKAADFSNATKKAKDNLLSALIELQVTTALLIARIRED